MNSTYASAWPRRLASAALSVLAASAAFAQQATGNDETVKLEKFVVTGSYIPAAADEALALPVQIVNAKEIAQTGATKSVLDVLRKAVPQIIGGNNIGVENGNVAGNSTQGGSSIALRNTATLVLIDGQRVAFDPVSGVGSKAILVLSAAVALLFVVAASPVITAADAAARALLP